MERFFLNFHPHPMGNQQQDFVFVGAKLFYVVMAPFMLRRERAENMDHILSSKEAIVKAGQEILRSHLVVGTWGNVSCRIAGENLFAITPSGMDYGEITPDDVVIVDLNGKIVAGRRKPSTELPLHLIFYQNRPDVEAIIHTHSTYATAFACARKEIPPLVEDLVQIVGGGVRVAQYALPGTRELGQSALDAARDRRAVLLANHGLLTLGTRLDEALKIALVVEKAAQVAIFATLLGEPVLLSPEDVETMHQFYLNRYGQR